MKPVQTRWNFQPTTMTRSTKYWRSSRSSPRIHTQVLPLLREAQALQLQQATPAQASTTRAATRTTSQLHRAQRTKTVRSRTNNVASRKVHTRKPLVQPSDKRRHQERMVKSRCLRSSPKSIGLLLILFSVAKLPLNMRRRKRQLT